MVKITYDEKKFTLSAEGHAQTAAKGHDILCAAVSILIYTLAQIILENAKCMKTPSVIELNEGKAFIKCEPKTEYTPKIKCIFDTIMTGFDLLENNYKKNIKIIGGVG